MHIVWWNLLYPEVSQLQVFKKKKKKEKTLQKRPIFINP